MGKVGAAAQILPRDASVTAHVVVDRQISGPDLDAGPFGVTVIALQADEFELERFIGEFDAGFGVADHATDETLTLLDDAPHVLLQHLEILGCEGSVAKS